MATYPLKVQLAWNIVEQFIKDWKKDPYYYDNEFSIQAEIYTRIKKSLELIGEQNVKANYDEKWIPKTYADKQNWCRVSAEPYFMYDKINKCYCHPDIVIWGDCAKNSGLKWYNGKNWPAQWICEIKVDSKTKTPSNDDENWDIEKMKQLIGSDDVQYGCWLNFIYELEPENVAKEEWQLDKSGKLWKRNCYFPRISPSK